METVSCTDTFVTIRRLILEGGKLNKPILEQNRNGGCEKTVDLLGRLYRTGCDLVSLVSFVILLKRSVPLTLPKYNIFESRLYNTRLFNQ